MKHVQNVTPIALNIITVYNSDGRGVYSATIPGGIFSRIWGIPIFGVVFPYI